MSNDIESRLQVLRSQSQDASRRYAQAEAQLDQVRSRRDETLTALRDKGFDSPEAAQARVDELSSEVETVLSEIQQKVSSQ